MNSGKTNLAGDKAWLDANVKLENFNPKMDQRKNGIPRSRSAYLCSNG